MLISDLSHLEVVTEDQHIQGGDLSALQAILAIWPNKQGGAVALANAQTSAAGVISAFTYSNTNTVTVNVGGIFASSAESSSAAESR